MKLKLKVNVHSLIWFQIIKLFGLNHFQSINHKYFIKHWAQVKRFMTVVAKSCLTFSLIRMLQPPVYRCLFSTICFKLRPKWFMFLLFNHQKQFFKTSLTIYIYIYIIYIINVEVVNFFQTLLTIHVLIKAKVTLN